MITVLLFGNSLVVFSEQYLVFSLVSTCKFRRNDLYCSNVPKAFGINPFEIKNKEIIDDDQFRRNN